MTENQSGKIELDPIQIMNPPTLLGVVRVDLNPPTGGEGGGRELGKEPGGQTD